MLDRWFFGRHLEEDEEVSCVVHKHPLMGVLHLFWPLVSLALALVALWALREARFGFLVAAAWSVASCVWLLRNFLDYYLDAWIVTTHGIVDVAWHGWFHRTSSRVLYSDIQGVSYEICGIAGTLLRYGSLTVEKISNGSTIELEYVPRPRRIESVILRNMEEYLHSKNMKDAKQVQDLLATLVAERMALQELEGEEEDDDEDDE